MLARVFEGFQHKSVGLGLAAVLPATQTPWYKRPGLVYLNFCLFSLFLLSSSNGYDGSMMNGLQALPQWQEFIRHPTGAWLGFVNAAQNLGSIILFSFVAWCSNRHRRKKTIALAYFWLCLGAGIQTGSSTAGQFVAGRVIVGMATSHFGGSVPVLMTEIAYPTHRGIITALFMCGWYVGKLAHEKSVNSQIMT